MLRTVDPETGYIGEICTGMDLGQNVRCKRCGGRAMLRFPYFSGVHSEPLCLRCADEWFQIGAQLLSKHDYTGHRARPRDWWAAFKEFLATKPEEIDITEHNNRVEILDTVIYVKVGGQR